MNICCPICGMPPLDGEPCCTREYAKGVIRAADRRIKAQDAELAALRRRCEDAERLCAQLRLALEDSACLCGVSIQPPHAIKCARCVGMTRYDEARAALRGGGK